MTPLSTIIGMIYPAHAIAKKILHGMLVETGLNPSDFPIGELAAYSVSLAKFRGKMMRQWYRMLLYDTTTGIAHGAIFTATGESDWSAKKIRSDVERGSPDRVWEILANHDPARFSLDALEQTQASLRRSIGS